MKDGTRPPPHRHGPHRLPLRRQDGRNTKQRILAAAEQVVFRDGVGHLALDTAAAEAGLSKGGILYHYPTRDSLVAAMVDRIIEQFEPDIARHLPEAGSPEAGLPGAYARAYVRATVEPAAAGEERLGAALLATAAAEPALLVPSSGPPRARRPHGRRQPRPGKPSRAGRQIRSSRP